MTDDIYDDILRFLDGDMNEVEQEAFFSNLASSPEMRAALREQMLIDKTLEYGRQNEPGPSSALFEEITAKAGLHSVPPAVATVGRPLISVNKFKRPAFAVAAAVIMLVLFFIPGINLFVSDTDDNTLQAPFSDGRTWLALPSQPQKDSNNSDMLLEEEVVTLEGSAFAAASNSTAKQGRGEVDRSSNPTAIATKVNAFGDILTENDDDLTPVGDILTENDNISTFTLAEDNVPPLANSLFVNSPSFSTPSLFSFDRSTPSPSPSAIATTDFELQIRGLGLASRSFPSPEIAPLAEPTLNNIAIGVLYALSDEHSIGMEIGQEFFLQEFFLLRDIDSLAFQQNSLTASIGLTYRYQPEELSMSLFRPFLQATLAGTQMGPLGRIAIGVGADITPRLRFFAMGEGTSLWYGVENRIFSTQKVNVSYGLSFKL